MNCYGFQTKHLQRSVWAVLVDLDADKQVYFKNIDAAVEVV